ncbi:unnamed protein product [Protopolystoma xenopodis]|uniref:Uncharacterized protein n=1 Tax=Protopolystoma xenopodis TaxID=117903 RepID=A0A448XKQ5_9PLAT|nr:unnamed protein product [Protopolystoma xenopodis]
MAEANSSLKSGIISSPASTITTTTGTSAPSAFSTSGFLTKVTTTVTTTSGLSSSGLASESSAPPPSTHHPSLPHAYSLTGYNMAHTSAPLASAEIASFSQVSPYPLESHIGPQFGLVGSYASTRSALFGPTEITETGGSGCSNMQAVAGPQSLGFPSSTFSSAQGSAPCVSPAFYPSVSAAFSLESSIPNSSDLSFGTSRQPTPLSRTASLQQPQQQYSLAGKLASRGSCREGTTSGSLGFASNAPISSITASSFFPSSNSSIMESNVRHSSQSSTPSAASTSTYLGIGGHLTTAITAPNPSVASSASSGISANSNTASLSSIISSSGRPTVEELETSVSSICSTSSAPSTTSTPTSVVSTGGSGVSALASLSGTGVGGAMVGGLKKFVTTGSHHLQQQWQSIAASTSSSFTAPNEPSSSSPSYTVANSCGVANPLWTVSSSDTASLSPGSSSVPSLMEPNSALSSLVIGRRRLKLSTQPGSNRPSESSQAALASLAPISQPVNLEPRLLDLEDCNFIDTDAAGWLNTRKEI